MNASYDSSEFYPFLFTPIYKPVMWGGDMLKTHLNRDLPTTDTPIGESWELSDRDDGTSVIENGPLQGVSLRELLSANGRAIVGGQYQGGPFPLLVKIIDAGKRLSLQVHPDNQTATQIPDAEPKTEMWYVIANKKDAKIFAGLSQRCTRSNFTEIMSTPEVESHLQSFHSQPGDGFFISAGTIHAIGAGNLLLEIQQNSNTTYRVSDWGRVGPDGQPRELHVENALRCINFGNRASPKITGVSGVASTNRKFPIVNQCPYFTVDDLKLIESWEDNADGSSFHLLNPINHAIQIVKDNQTTEIPAGRTCLVPAIYGNYQIEVQKDKQTTVIKTVL